MIVRPYGKIGLASYLCVLGQSITPMQTQIYNKKQEKIVICAIRAKAYMEL